MQRQRLVGRTRGGGGAGGGGERRDALDLGGEDRGQRRAFGGAACGKILDQPLGIGQERRPQRVVVAALLVADKDARQAEDIGGRDRGKREVGIDRRLLDDGQRRQGRGEPLARKPRNSGARRPVKPQRQTEVPALDAPADGGAQRGFKPVDALGQPQPQVEAAPVDAAGIPGPAGPRPSPARRRSRSSS